MGEVMDEGGRWGPACSLNVGAERPAPGRIVRFGKPTEGPRGSAFLFSPLSWPSDLQKYLLKSCEYMDKIKVCVPVSSKEHYLEHKVHEMLYENRIPWADKTEKRCAFNSPLKRVTCFSTLELLRCLDLKKKKFDLFSLSFPSKNLTLRSVV